MDITEFVEDAEEVLKLDRRGDRVSRYSRKKYINDHGPIDNMEKFYNWLELVDHFVSPKNMDLAWEIYYECESLQKNTVLI